MNSVLRFSLRPALVRDLDCERCPEEVLTWAPGRASARLHEGHLGVRFGDWRFNVTLDGERIIDCIELVMDRDGVGEALCFVSPLDVCQGGAHLRREIRRGRFSVDEPPANGEGE